MPAAIATREDTLAHLLETFRANGWDGASLAEISKATGLGKSSLYHAFPNGKDQMTSEVLELLARQLEESLFAPLALDAPPQKKLAKMLAAIDAFYAGGSKACLIQRIYASTAGERFQPSLGQLVDRWISAFEQLARDAGVSRAVARARAEDAVIRIEGALVVCAALGDTKPFARTLADLKKTLLDH